MSKRQVPFVQQLNAVECGTACLAMILSYHGRHTTVSECRSLCDGLTARAIAIAAREFGLRVKAYSLEPAQFAHVPLPAVVHWEFNHFMVVEDWSVKEIKVADPAAGRRTLSAKEFDAGFTGVVLTFEPGAHFAKHGSTHEAAWLKYLRLMFDLPGLKRIIAQILATSLVLQLLGLALPAATKTLVDYILPFHMNNVMLIFGAGILWFVVTQMLVSYLRSSLLIYLRSRLDSHLTQSFFEHLLSLPFSFFQKRTSGDLLMRLGSNSFIREVLTNTTLTVLLDGTFVLMYLLLLLSVAPLFGLLVASLAAAQLLILAGSRARINQLMQRELSTRAEEQGYLVEAVAGVSMLKASGAEDRAFDRWSTLFINHLNVSLERSRVSLLIDTALGGLRTLSPLVLLWVGALFVLSGNISLGTMLAMSSLAAAFLNPIAALVTNGQQFQMIGAHLERIADVFEAEPEQPPGNAVTAHLSGRIEARDISFQYDSNCPLVLRDISFAVEPGQKVALVGPTGSGKSTLAALLLGFFQPTHGEILYDCVPLKKFNYRSLRGQMGVVLQDPILFSGSILQNISLSNPEISMEKVVEAATLAEVHEDISMMPMLYETMIAEGGTTLSGGQRQRLALARALVNQPKVLVLDEATSHLDVQTEAVVDKNLNTLSCTRIVIAHRLSTVRNADQILVLDKGRLVERGRHEDLMAMEGTYAALVNDQLGGARARSPLVEIDESEKTGGAQLIN